MNKLIEQLDFGRDGPNSHWHRRWLIFFLTVVPFAFGVFCIIWYGPADGMPPAMLFVGTAFVKGLEYTVARWADSAKGNSGD